MGGYFLNWWAFPYDIIQTTLFHHEPDNKNVHNRKLVSLMCVASQLEEDGGAVLNSNYLFALEELGFTELEIQAVVNKFAR